MLAERLLAEIRDPLQRALVPILTAPAGTSSGGWPFLADDAFAALRDRVPHILSMGPRVVDAVDEVHAAADRLAGPNDERAVQNVAVAGSVVRTVVNTAAITAPSDLWLLRFVLGALAEAGVAQRLLAGERIDPAECLVRARGGEKRADRRELDVDLSLLLARGYVVVADGRYALAPHPRARAVLSAIAPVPQEHPPHAAELWARAFAGRPVDDGEAAALIAVAAGARARTDVAQDTWIATADEIELGYRLLPVVLGLRAAQKHKRLAGAPIAADELAPGRPDVGARALDVLRAAGVLADDGAATAVGKRVLDKGAGPMGIIEAYHTYCARLLDILVEGRGAAWVARGKNVAASQDANRATFEKANDSLDEMCAATGFRFGVFVEHAIGAGEATRQRFVRSGEQAIRYFGADLEDAAIDAALAEQKAGRLPKNMVLLRHVDIGDPKKLVDELTARGVDTRDAVMMVGNGFHEVRAQTDARMVDVFRGYHDAGFVLLFTEESALSVDDLLATAWNTYHAGFKYVHEKSGQGLRPADPSPPARVGAPLRASWMECASRAGYVRLEKFSSRTRTIYPTQRKGAHNPNISVSHFCVPSALAERLKL